MGYGPMSRLEQKAMFAKLNAGEINGLRSSDIYNDEQLLTIPKKEQVVNLGIIKNHLRKINETAKHNKKIKEAEKQASELQKKLDREKIEENKQAIDQLKEETDAIARGKAHSNPHEEALVESRKHKTLPRAMTPKELLEYEKIKNKGGNDNKTSIEKERENKIIVNITNEPEERRDALGNSKGKKTVSTTSSNSNVAQKTMQPSSQITEEETVSKLSDNVEPSPTSQKSRASSSSTNYDDAISASLGDAA